ncbi:MAG TPA: formimidoylglutamate deiminase [Roseiarcus sp.]|nr:formimidoylglutamate deiminase [Roseiarcus sp.]
MTVLHFARALTPDGWRSDVRLTLAGARIGALEFGVAPQAGDERHALGLPALANLHSHAFQRAMAGLAERRGDARDTFWTWRETMYRFALTMDPDQIEATAAQLYVEMLEAGFSAVAEFHYLHNAPDGSPYAHRAELAERIAAAAAIAGIGLTLLPVFYAHATFGGAPPRPEQRRFITDLDGFARLVEDCRPLAEVTGVAPHSLRAVTPHELDAVAKLANGGPIHMHVAEQIKEVEDCLDWSGARPVRWLLDHADVDARWCAIHATHMDEGEARALATSGAVVGLCPLTEASLGDGVINVEYFRARGAFGVGSDSNIEIGVAAELKQLEYAQRLARRERNVLARAGGSTGRALYEGATAGGARALRRDGGGLAAGAIADLVSLDLSSPQLAGRADDEILDAWIFTNARVVDCVWSGGVRQVSGGRHVAREHVAARFVAAVERLAHA